jgi:hypothetical protein
VKTIQEQNKAYNEEKEQGEKEYIQQQQKTLTKLEQRPAPPLKQKDLEKELEQAEQEIKEVPNPQQKEEVQAKINQIQQTLQEIKKTSLTSTVDIDLLEQKEPGIKDH